MALVSTFRLLPISIVIPVRDEVEYFDELFSSLRALNPRPAEVVFVDTSTKDDTTKAIKNWIDKIEMENIRCHLCHLPGAYPGAARNAGVNATTQPWIAFIDSGITPRVDWLGKLWLCRIQKNALAVYGVCSFHSEHPFGRMVCAISYGQGRTIPVLPSSLFHKVVFERAGYFEESLRSGEDILWKEGIQNTGISIVVCHDAIVDYCHFPNQLGNAIKKWYVYEQSATTARVSHSRKNVLLVVIALIYGFAAFDVPGSTVVLAGYLALRGVVDPYRRSVERPWWRYWWQPVAMIPVAALLDFAIMAGRLTSKLGLSKFHLGAKPAN